VASLANTLDYVGLAFAAAGVGALGGLGGAVLLVPALVLTGVNATAAAPLGLICVAAGSVAAGSQQLVDRAVNHRIGIATELAASTAAVVGAVVSGLVSERVLTLLLAITALAAALAGARRSGLRNPPREECRPDDVGERIGSLAGAYPVSGGIAPYAARRLPLGLGLMGIAGLMAGTIGASGGFIKTPAMSEVMHVPTKVAAATTTFTVGITSATALVVFAIQGRIDASASAAVILGSLLGGYVGARFQARLSPIAVRRGLSMLLVAVAIALVVRL
jgi:uncharacterized membrane protein YfcA